MKQIATFKIIYGKVEDPRIRENYSYNFYITLNGKIIKYLNNFYYDGKNYKSHAWFNQFTFRTLTTIVEYYENKLRKLILKEL